MTRQEILERLDKKAFYEQEVGPLRWNDLGEGKTHCPFHKDRTPSLSVDSKTGAFLCFGCGEKGSVFDFYMKRHGMCFSDAKEALAGKAGTFPTPERRIVMTYDYRDEVGNLLFQTVRYEPKDFKQRRPDGKGNWIYNLKETRLVPYNLPEVLKVQSILIVEGEKDVETLRELGIVATCNAMGAGKWKPEFNQNFKGKKVSVMPDNDKQGRKHADMVAENLQGVADSVKIVNLPELPEKGDVSDWIAGGRTREKLLELIEAAPEWEPSESPDTKKVRERGQISVVSMGIVDFLQKEFPPREDILSPWLPTQGLTMIYGHRGIGKSHVAMGIALAVSSGATFLRWTAPIPRGVLYIDGEMPATTVQERFSRIILSNDKEPTALLKIITPDIQPWGMPDLASTKGQENLETHLEGIELVILDNISTLCRSGRENDSDDWRIVQEWALQLRSRGISAVLIHHAGKGGHQRGSSKKEDVLDTVIALKKPTDYVPDEGAHFEVHFEKARMIYGDDVKSFDVRLISDENTHRWEIKDLEDSLTEKVARYLNEGVPQKEIHDMLGVSKGTVSKHKRKAEEQGLIHEIPSV